MILFVNDNVGILFLRTIGGGPIYGYIYGTTSGETIVVVKLVGFGRREVTIATFTTVSGDGVLKRWASGLIETFSTVSGNMRGLGALAGAVYTFTTTSARAIVTGFLYGTINTWTTVRATKPVRWVTEVVRKSSVITRILGRNSRIDGD